MSKAVGGQHRQYFQRHLSLTTGLKINDKGIFVYFLNDRYSHFLGGSLGTS